VSEIGNTKNTKRAHISNIDFRNIRICIKPNYWNSRALCDFESTRVYIPIEYDSILTAYYGDYMTLPPEFERIPKHIEGQS